MRSKLLLAKTSSFVYAISMKQNPYMYTLEELMLIVYVLNFSHLCERLRHFYYQHITNIRW